jgi:hypothetical protein
MRRYREYLICVLLIISCYAIPMFAQRFTQRFTQRFDQQEISEEWLHGFKTALKSGDINKIKGYYEPAFAEEELESWKYQLKRGYLNFNGSIVLPLTKDMLLVYIPTDSSSYSGENSEKYFDFIYRIYKIKEMSNPSSQGTPRGLAVNARCMDEINPDFLTCREKLEFFPTTQTMSVDSEVKTNLKSNRLIFKLAKEFQIESLEINGKKHSYHRYGYFITTPVNAPNPVTFRIKGKIAAVSDHNQFFAIDENHFFLRFGGFAATPVPPPGNMGRCYFSSDQATFEREIRFPARYKFLAYGDKIKDETVDGIRTVSTRLTGKYDDTISVYAHTGWNVKTIRRGNVTVGFYFPAADHKEQTFLENKINSLMDWLNGIFKKDSTSEFAINFVVLDKFVKSGVLNDSKSIIASKASIIGSGGGGYIHELCHLAPQPHIAGNALWEKEGFTNYLAFNFLRDELGETDFWKRQKISYLKRTELYCEPLAAITNKGIPCYWSVYQKGPWIYRMLETEIGKENFERAMIEFSKREGKTLADTAEYFKIFETVSGKDLSTFRNQWLERKQNPVLTVRHTVKPSGKKSDGKNVTIVVSQEVPMFEIPLQIEIRTEKRTIRRTVQLDRPVKSISIPIKSRLISIEYDPDARVFATIRNE